MAGVSFHWLADAELNDAACYYDQESPGLGSTFLSEVERCVTAIVDHPEAAVPIRGQIRRRILRRFPYALLYIVKPAGIRILAVMNLKRRPMYWVGRA